MGNAIFTTSESSAYDDEPEEKYHFPRKYLKQASEAVRNGLALTGTAHWRFDRGLISVDDSLRVIVATSGLPAGLDGLIGSGRTLKVPATAEHRPHPRFLRWHRENRFKG